MNFKDLVENFDRSILVCGPSLEVKYMNLSARKELRVDSAHFESLKVFDILTISQKDKESLAEALLNVHPIKLNVFIRVDKKDNELIENQLICKPIGFSDEGTRLFLLELTESVSSTITIERVKSLGNVTGDLAHAISNPLAVIQINCDSLGIQCDKAPSIKSNDVQVKVDKIGSALERVTSETDKLKDISRKLSDCDEMSLELILPKPDDIHNH